MADEILLGALPSMLGRAQYEGMTSYCVGYALDGGGLIYLSMVGYGTANKAIWAALMERGYVNIAYKPMRRMTNCKYVKKSVVLQENGGEHMILLCEQASLEHMVPGQDFYLLNATTMPPYARFLAMANKCISLPLLPGWAEMVWKVAMRRELIEQVYQSSGTTCWKVSADEEKWLDLVQAGVRAGKLTAEVGNGR